MDNPKEMGSVLLSKLRTDAVTGINNIPIGAAKKWPIGTAKVTPRPANLMIGPPITMAIPLTLISKTSMAKLMRWDGIILKSLLKKFLVHKGISAHGVIAIVLSGEIRCLNKTEIIDKYISYHTFIYFYIFII